MVAPEPQLDDRLSHDQLLRLPRLGKSEYRDGKIIMTPAGGEHGGISLTLASLLLAYVKPRKLGMAMESSTGFGLPNGDVLAPDASFISRERLTGRGGPPKKYFDGAPDLAIEVKSPNDRWPALESKMHLYFAHGCRLAWIVDPSDQTVRVYRSPDAYTVATAGQSLDGGDVLPGFTVEVDEIFDLPVF
jgi:Uma2 family endonuclease